MEQSRFHNNKQNEQQEKYFHTRLLLSLLSANWSGAIVVSTLFVVSPSLLIFEARLDSLKV